MYFAGTTGQTKGIDILYRAPAVSYEWRFYTLLDYGPRNVVACNIFFVWKALCPLMRGDTVLPVPDDDIFDGERLACQMENFSVTKILFLEKTLESSMLLNPTQIPMLTIESNIEVDY